MEVADQAAIDLRPVAEYAGHLRTEQPRDQCIPQINPIGSWTFCSNGSRAMKKRFMLSCLRFTKSFGASPTTIFSRNARITLCRARLWFMKPTFDYSGASRLICKI